MTDQTQRHFLQPHEGVMGINRSGDPVLEYPGMSDLIGRLTVRLKSARLLAAQAVPAEYQNMFDVKEGELVVVEDPFLFKNVEQSTLYQAVGYFIGRRSEWWNENETWEKNKTEDETLTEDDRMVEPDAVYIQYGPKPEMICRWVNCNVLKAA